MRARAAIALVTDAVLVTTFAAVGRASHESAVLPGLAQTAWPFLVALAAGWTLARAWRDPLAPWRTGIIVWLVTVTGGMLLRAASGQGTAFAFVVVATLTLLLFVVGWRLLAAALRSLRARRTVVP
ncbi:MAG: DUF3054 domain-containing protein [Candidatus Microbacterium phytovorans]|uniref:DUF3054 domain-containing protein n=1 Tax=Candidatus Microbacterium phytovorans TaxID=3121374 RepID=A0AAJ6B4A8_9MICO|nr:DUF3054 domain-containing protein [Microbacterium sp.]WEK13984.1 MAG: DUF3054 domain-containing protein [Microbacterium sp.]